MWLAAGRDRLLAPEDALIDMEKIVQHARAVLATLALLGQTDLCLSGTPPLLQMHTCGNTVKAIVCVPV